MGRESPDWLPPGWKVNVKVRGCGRKDKYYFNPSNGLKFSSKPEVLRYLETSKEASKPKEPTKINIEKTVAEKLPPGWIKEVRVRNKGGRTRRDPYYIDPVSGRHFRSMQEVYHHLESRDPVKSGPKEENSGDLNAEAKDHSKSTPEANGERFIDTKVDKRFTRLASKKTESEHASVSKDVATNKGDLQSVRENQLDLREGSLVVKHSDKILPVNKAEPNVDPMKGNGEIARSEGGQSRSGDGEKTLESVEKVGNHDFDTVERRDGEDPAAVLLSNKLLPENGGKQNKESDDNKARTRVGGDQSLQSGAEDASGKILNTPEATGLVQQQGASTAEGGRLENAARTNNKRKKSNNKWMSDLPRRTSKRLARATIDESLEVKTPEPTLMREAGVSTAENIVDNVPNGGLAKYRTENLGTCSEQNVGPTISRTDNPANDKETHPTTPLGDHPRLQEHKKEDEQEKNLDSSLENILMDPCIEFAIKTLTGVIPIENANKVVDSPVSSLASADKTSTSPSVLASGDIWADPCFEFAVKTLTGEMPVEDRSAFQISFQQPFASSASGITVQKSRLDNFNPLDYSFNRFGTVKNPHPIQEHVRDTGLPHHTMNAISPAFTDASFGNG